MFPPYPCQSFRGIFQPVAGRGATRRVKVGSQRWTVQGELSQPPSLFPRAALPPLWLLSEALGELGGLPWPSSSPARTAQGTSWWFVPAELRRQLKQAASAPARYQRQTERISLPLSKCTKFTALLRPCLYLLSFTRQEPEISWWGGLGTSWQSLPVSGRTLLTTGLLRRTSLCVVSHRGSAKQNK